MYCRSLKSWWRSQPSHPLRLALKLLNLISSICHLDTVEKKLFCIGLLDTIQKIICQGHQRLEALWSSLSNDHRQGLLSSFVVCFIFAVTIYIPVKIDHKDYCQLVKARILPSYTSKKGPDFNWAKLTPKLEEASSHHNLYPFLHLIQGGF